MMFRTNVIVSGGLFSQQVAVFLTGVIVARLLGPGAFGEFGILKNLSTFVLILTPLGLDVALLKHANFYTDKPGELKLLVSALRALVAIVNAALLGLIFLGFGNQLQKIYPSAEHFAYYSSLTMIGVIFAADQQISGALFRVAGRLVPFSLIANYGQPLIRLGLSFGVLWLGGGLEGVIWSNNAALILSFLLIELVSATRKTVVIVPKDKSLTKSGKLILSESLWMALSLLAYQAMRFFDVLVLGALTTVEQTGEYAAFSSVCQIIQIYPMAVSQTLGPTIASLYHSNRTDEISGELKKYVRTASLLGGYIFAGVAVFGTHLDLIFGHGFVFSWQLTILLSTGWYVSTILAPFGYVLSMTGRHKHELVILIIGSCLLILCLLLLIPLLGNVGAAISVLAAFLFVNIIRCFYVIHIIQQNPLRLSDLYAPLLFIGLAVCCVFIEHLMGARSLFVLIIGCFAYTLACAIAYIFLFATHDESEKIQMWISYKGRQI